MPQSSTASKQRPHVIIQSIVQENALAKTFILRPSGILDYQAGQFLTLLFPDPLSGAMQRRAYSFSSTPGVDPLPAITVKRTPNGLASRRLIDRIAEGDCLSYSHISGRFTLPDDLIKHRHLVFFAAGSGIVPVYSLLKAMLAFKPKEVRATLIYSSHARKDTLFYHELQQLQQKHGERLHIRWLFTRPDTERTHGRLSHFLLLDLLKHPAMNPLSQTLFYICGPFEYMDMISIVLKTEGVPPDHIRQEHFYIPRGTTPPQPPDKRRQKVTLRLGARNYVFPCQYPDSILAAALKHHVPLQFSCQSGQCGSCAVKCVQGKVWMRYNEVLTQKELQEGMTLTCCGFPIGGPVILEK